MGLARTVLMVGAFLALLALPARADEVAPELEGSDLRQKAQTELKKVFATLDAKDQKRLVGTYAVFDANASDPFAQVACDDDGDYVVLISDAMLRLVSHVARAQSYDEANGARRIEDYASFLARSQLPGRRLLPPPPGFYIAQKPAATYEDRFGEGLAFIVAHEVTRLRAGDLVCPKPTATKESGDDEWTAAEQRKAGEVAASVYPARTLERDTEATVRLLQAGRSERGALGLLKFFTQFEAERVVAVSRFQPTYLAHHPGSASRASTVRSAVDNHREAD
jgi:hypothetical protein